LDDQLKPWVFTEEGRPADHRFKGYSLDEKRRPTFRYQFDSVDTEEYFQPIPAKNSAEGETVKVSHLRRTVKLTSVSGRKGLRFRLGAGQKIERVAERVFAIDGKLRIRVESGQDAKISDAGSGLSLELGFDLAPGQKQEFVFDYLWD